MLASTVFLRTHMHHRSVEDGLVYMGALFTALCVQTLYGLFELTLTVVKLPVFYKQRDIHLFPAWAYAIPTWLLKVPVTFVECAVYVTMTYYTIGYEPNIHRMFRQLLIFTLMSLTSSGLFRFLGACGREQVIANIYGSFAATILILLGGYVISRNSIKIWWSWVPWVSPMMYAYNAVVVSEFLGPNWRHVTNSTESTETLGVQVIKSHGLFQEQKWYWIGVGALVAFLFLYNLLYAAALSFLNPIRKGQTIVAGLEEKPTNTTEDNTSTHEEREKIKMTPAMPDDNPSEYGKKKGMVLPFPPLSIVFEDIKYSVDMPKELRKGVQEDRLMLLKGASGAFRPGVLTALMGVTGAGKTTLMDVLAGRKTGGYIDGSISISGYPKKAETFARISGYCEQNDIHSPNVTVHESLIYSAWLRLPKEIDSNSREMFIEEVMELVELTSLRNALVGLPRVSGLSTEQRKRLTIAVELVANPSIIFMDEPTSGLDARAAAIVMRTIRNTVDTGRTVVCTIHQPSIDIFDSFDELFLMKRGGEEIYFGPIGHKGTELIKYFESIPGIAKIKDGYNPATWMLEVSTIAQEAALGINFTEIYHNSELYRRNKSLIGELSTPPPGSRDLYFPTKYSQSFITQWLACLWKQHNSYWRNPSYNAIRYVFTTLLALVNGTIFWNLGDKRGSIQQLLNAMGSMYTALMFMGMQNSQVVLPVVDTERTVFYREKFAGMYSALTYAMAQVVIEIPYTFAQAILYSVLVYSMIGFQWTAVKFIWYIFFTFFTLLCFTYYGIMVSVMTPNAHVGSVTAAATYSLWNIFAGFLITRPRLPKWYKWTYWSDPVAWALYGLMVSQFGDVDDIMDNGVSVKDFIREYSGYKHSFLPFAAIAIVGFCIVFATSFAFAIKILNFQKR
ncbi:ABC transporter G family member 39 [Rhynchospora pubera]|uniref:ABC transporter G family member 39 n=1 Tax=Rhynchospora pubera TaxID=906938 RepID=A0AAV8FND1_9POAL|nr:ABC transporter G family member 39 [Rhynchospora pubera]